MHIPVRGIVCRNAVLVSSSQLGFMQKIDLINNVWNHFLLVPTICGGAFLFTHSIARLPGEIFSTRKEI